MATRQFSNRTPSVHTTPTGYGKSLLLTMCIFVLMLILAGICIGVVKGLFTASERDGALAASVVQNIVAFFGASLLTSFFLSSSPLAFIGITTRLRGITVFNIVICFIIGMPFLNEIVFLNSQMHLPAALSEVEQWARRLEDSAEAQVNALLGVSSIGGLIVNILIIGVLTGFCEELFFRGTLQRVLASHGHNRHLAVWMAALIFSALHFQFFGFLPRMILGAFFGYIFMWTGSIRASALAHAIFNSITVAEVWLINRGVQADVIEKYGVQTHGFPWIACVSLALVVGYILIQRRRGF